MKNIFAYALAAAPLLLGQTLPAKAQAPAAPMHMPAPAAGPIRVENAWARANAGKSAVSGAFLTIFTTGTIDRLVGASSPVAPKVELHETTMEGTIMRMRPVAGVDLAPGRPVELKPGGLHIMLVGMPEALRAGDHFPLTLTFAHAAPLTVQVLVVPAGGGAPHKH